MGELKKAYEQSRKIDKKHLPNCPLCRENALDVGFVGYTFQQGRGWGAVWCDNCRAIEYFATEIETDTPIKAPPLNGYKAMKT